MLQRPIKDEGDPQSQDAKKHHRRFPRYFLGFVIGRSLSKKGVIHKPPTRESTDDSQRSENAKPIPPAKAHKYRDQPAKEANQTYGAFGAHAPGGLFNRMLAGLIFPCL